ncbi:MAG: 2-hydroxyacyl-CoA dehydratase [Syntrophaceae bacterium]|nr:2-hydroxyacyl-CoA dehydratase [Syntrophaceae bacterium]
MKKQLSDSGEQIDNKMARKHPVHRHAKRMTQLIRVAIKFGMITHLFIKYILEPLVKKEETKYNSWFRQILFFAGGSCLKPSDRRALIPLTSGFVNYFRRIVQSEKLGKPIIWVDWCFSSELLKAFDVVAYACEAPVLLCDFIGTRKASMLVEKAEKEGVPLELCSSSKGAVGAYLLKEAPEPDLILSTSHPCDSTASLYQLLRYMTGVPAYVLDTPYWNDKKSIEYYTNNIRGLIQFIEKHLHQKINWETLKHVCENINTTNYYMSELTEMARAVPSPISVMHLLLLWLGRTISYGSDELAESAKRLYAVAKARLDKKEGHLENERIRIIWWDIPVGFYNIHSWLEQEFGAITVADMIGRVEPFHIDTSSRESMLEGLAVTNLNAPMGRHMRGPAEFITNELERVIREFTADCFIFSQHTGCTHEWAIMKIIKDICGRTGLPALFLDADCFEARHSSEKQIKKQIRDFFMNHGLA